MPDETPTPEPPAADDGRILILQHQLSDLTIKVARCKSFLTDFCAVVPVRGNIQMGWQSTAKDLLSSL